MGFKELLLRAKASDKAAMQQIIEMYRPLMRKYAKVNGVLDEDLYQEMVYHVILCIRKYPLE